MKTYVNDSGFVIVWFDDKKYITIYCDSYELVYCKSARKETELAYKFLDKKGNEIVHLWARFVDTIMN